MLEDPAPALGPYGTRRHLLALGASLFAVPAAAAAPEHGAPTITPAAALGRLAAGNRRFVQGLSSHPDQSAERRKSLVGSQRPFATILSCSDSRVPPELIFDQGLGDLFVVRVAGNVVDETALASVEYAVIHLDCPLIMVLGHAHCGAVTATMEALDGKPSPDDAGTHIGALAALISPAVKAAPANSPDRLGDAIVINAERSAAAILAGSSPLRTRAQAGSLRVVSARYELETGAISHLRATPA